MASEYLKWKYRDVRPDPPLQLTREQRLRNWWHYHKWHLAVGAVVLAIAGNIVWRTLTQVRPDYQIAYVGSVPLTEEQTAAWEEGLAALGTDCNGDGKVTVRLEQYLTAGEGGDAEYAYASNVRLMADLDGRDSYFFLLDDPEGFQKSYEILEEDWIPVKDGLFLARRAFWQDRTGSHMEDCQRLWEQLTEEENQ